MKRVLVLILGLATVTSVHLAQAATFRSSADNLSVAGNDQAADLYLAAGRVSIDRSVTGDLVAAGRSVLVNGEVEGSVFAAAESVAIRSKVGRHARIAGGTMTISGSIDGDLLVAGEVIELTETASVGGDLLVVGGEVIVNGQIKGLTKIRAKKVNLNGRLGQTTVWTDRLTVGARAEVADELSYHAPSEASVDPAAKLAGGLKFTKKVSPDNRFGLLADGFWWLLVLGSILSVWLLIKILPRTSHRLVGQFKQNWLAKLAVGLIGLIVTPIAVVILAVSGLGAPLAMVLATLGLMVFVLAALVGKLILGAWLMGLFRRQSSPSPDWPGQLDWRAAVVGVLALAILSFLPIIGPAVEFIVWLAGLGSLIYLLKRADTLGAGE